MLPPPAQRARVVAGSRRKAAQSAVNKIATAAQPSDSSSSSDDDAAATTSTSAQAAAAAQTATAPNAPAATTATGRPRRTCNNVVDYYPPTPRNRPLDRLVAQALRRGQKKAAKKASAPAPPLPKSRAARAQVRKARANTKKRQKATTDEDSDEEQPAAKQPKQQQQQQPVSSESDDATAVKNTQKNNEDSDGDADDEMEGDERARTPSPITSTRFGKYKQKRVAFAPLPSNTLSSLATTHLDDFSTTIYSDDDASDFAATPPKTMPPPTSPSSSTPVRPSTPAPREPSSSPESSPIRVAPMAQRQTLLMASSPSIVPPPTVPRKPVIKLTIPNLEGSDSDEEMQHDGAETSPPPPYEMAIDDGHPEPTPPPATTAPPFSLPDSLEGSDDDDEDAAAAAAQKLEDELTQKLRKLPSPNRRPRRRRARERAVLEARLWEDETILARLVPETRKARTGAALRENRSDIGQRGFWRRDEIRGLMRRGIEELRRRGDPASSIGADLLHKELRCASVVAKRLIGSRYEEGLISGIEMIKFARGLSDSDLASFLMSRLSCRALFYCKTWAEYKAVHDANPDLHACNYKGVGTYLIVVRHKGENGEELALYVGATWDEAMSKRHCVHKQRFKNLKAAEESGLANEISKHQYEQPKLYRRETRETLHFVLTRHADNLSWPHIGQWLELLGYEVTGKALELLGETHLASAHTRRMLASMEEHIMCVMFGSIATVGYPGEADIYGARWPRRKKEGANSIVPVCGFADLREGPMNGRPHLHYLPAHQPAKTPKKLRGIAPVQLINTVSDSASLVAARSAPSPNIIAIRTHYYSLVQSMKREREQRAKGIAQELDFELRDEAPREDQGLVDIVDVEQDTATPFLTDIDWLKIRRKAKADDDVDSDCSSASSSSDEDGKDDDDADLCVSDDEGSQSSDDEADSDVDTAFEPSSGLRLIIRKKPNGERAIRLPGTTTVLVNDEPRTVARVSAFSQKVRKAMREALYGEGLIGSVHNGFLVAHLPGDRHYVLDTANVTNAHLLVDGVQVRFKLRATEGDWECQPMAASPAASWVIATHRIIVDQTRGGRTCRHRFEPFGEVVDADWCDFLGVVADLVALDDDRMPFAQPRLTHGALYGVGLRLRHRGARFHLEPTSDGRIAFVLPGSRDEHDRLGRRRRPSSKPGHPHLVEMFTLPLAPPPNGPHDIIISVNDSTIGDYHSLRFALRPRDREKGASEPVESWTTIEAEAMGIEAWKVAFLLNVMYQTWGCTEEDLFHPRDVA